MIGLASVGINASVAMALPESPRIGTTPVGTLDLGLGQGTPTVSLCEQTAAAMYAAGRTELGNRLAASIKKAFEIGVAEMVEVAVVTAYADSFVALRDLEAAFKEALARCS